MRFKNKEAYKHLYRTAAWQRLRSQRLQEEPFCRFCAIRGVKTPGFAVDHIKPHKGDWTLFVDYDNTQTLCESCHNSTKQKQENGKVVIHYDARGWPVKG